jgi:hypothetical protein
MNTTKIKSLIYHTAIEALKDNEIWNYIKNRCDEIGYCSFTPKE